VSDAAACRHAEELRASARLWPKARLRWHIRSTQETLALPDIAPVLGVHLGRRINRQLCHLHLSIFRDELRRRQTET